MERGKDTNHIDNISDCPEERANERKCERDKMRAWGTGQQASENEIADFLETIWKGRSGRGRGRGGCVLQENERVQRSLNDYVTSCHGWAS